MIGRRITTLQVFGNRPRRCNRVEKVAAREHRRSKGHTEADWQFTIADARLKLHRLYPAM